MLKKIGYVTLLLLLHLQAKSQKGGLAYSSEALKIIPLTDSSFIHVSYLDIPDVGRFSCNGLIYLNSGLAVVFDTPQNNAAASELIQWVTETKKHQIKAVVVNHFHDDCTGGLPVFHKLGVPSYAHGPTLALAKEEGNPVPQNGFEKEMELEVGGEKIINRYFGEAHTTDNIVSYIPSEELLFGGCMIKSINAKKGNLEDANEAEWSHTVENIKRTYSNIKIVIPGHGEQGGMELLDYTSELFKPNKP